MLGTARGCSTFTVATAGARGARFTAGGFGGWATVLGSTESHTRSEYLLPPGTQHSRASRCGGSRPKLHKYHYELAEGTRHAAGSGTRALCVDDWHRPTKTEPNSGTPTRCGHPRSTPTKFIACGMQSSGRQGEGQRREGGSGARARSPSNWPQKPKRLKSPTWVPEAAGEP